MNRKMRFGIARPSWNLAFSSLLLAGVLALPSCKKEYFEPDRIKDATWNPELAVPLIKSNITVPEVLDRFDDQDIIVVDTTGILALRYFSNIFSVSAENVLVIQDQSDNVAYALTPSDIVTLTGGSNVTLPTLTYDAALNLTNLSSVPEIQSIDFKAGTLLFAVTTQYNYPTTVRIRIPGLTPIGGGAGFDQTVSGVTSSNPQTVSVPLAGKSLDLAQGAQGFNEIRILADATIGAGGTGAPGDRLDVGMTIAGPQFSTLLGDIKQQSFGAPASEVRIRFFENQQDGTITWADPRVKAIFNNQVGAGLRLDVAQLDFQDATGNNVGLNGPLMNSPVLGFTSTIGGIQTTIIDVNRGNSNIVNVAASAPVKLLYEVSALTNPAGGASVNWLQDTSKIGLDMEVFLPFDGTAVDFAKSDTAQVDIFPLNGDIQEIESVTFRLTIDNGFPADAHAQVYFYDSTLTDHNFVGIPQPIDSMFVNARAVVFASPTPGANGRVDQNNKRRTVLDITLDREKLNKLEANKFTNLVSRGWIDTYDAGSRNVQVFSDYSMDLWLGVIVKIKANVGL